MSSRSWVERVQDILEAIAEIQAFTEGLDFDRFREDAKTMKAVQLDLIVMGEAAAIPTTVQEAHPGVLGHLMRAMRNRLVHAYFSVDPLVLWDTLQGDLPPLRKSLQKLLDETSS